MSGVAVAIGGSALIGAIASSDSSRRAAHTASDAAKASQIDLDKLDEQTRRIAKQNALDSAELERQLTPEVPELRRLANQSVINGLNDKSSEDYKKLLESKLGTALDTPLLKAAIAKAQADLGLGGKLSQDVQNATVRRGLAAAGTAGPGLGLGRDVAARDLGLTSYGIEQDRLKTAAGLGSQEMDLASNNSTNLLNKLSLLNSINSNQKNFALGAAQYGQNIAQPTVGLDPSSIANIYAGNASNKSAALSNQANIYGAQGQGYLNAAGQLGMLAYLKGSSGGSSGGNSAGWMQGG